ncbi:LysM peptidoglycan-binding domain-containing protein [Streptomyces aureoverticillatus]|uniref:LysM peptidoglycan-binding domain-containing protein n=1 Tax=Streptomyces aureoverticillatus TaxID=66871 RepID=UPI0013DA750D|nr:LysM peptidoglycan-binding domain-containing protein [Streptomyces aureoverticillatus]QIB49554.1 LysM peptidoglycan-binding domain-containing protein [Streptomyces aureoverticillatus]
MRTPAPTGPGRTPVAVLRALASLAVLAAAVAGLPLLLLRVTPVVWDTSHDDLTHLLDRQDTGGAFLFLLLLIAWIGWAQFTLCTLAEIPAQLRGRTWKAPRGLGSSQRLASVLIGSIIVLLPTGTALANPATAAPAATAALHPQQAPQTPQPGPTEHTAPATADDTASTYTVRDIRPAESLWSIAEDQLGDGERWRDIAQLNDGRTMADGSIFHASTFLQPGWQLRMPDTAATQNNAPAPQGERAKGVTVRPGDTLWKIAEDELGDGTKYGQIFEENRGAPQPGGTTLTDPDDIRTGLKLDIPHPTAPKTPSDKAKPDAAPPRSGDRDDTERGSASGGTGEASKAPKEEHEEHDRGQQPPPPAKPDTAGPKKPAVSPPASTAPSTPASPAPAAPEETKPRPEQNTSDESDDAAVGVREVAGIGMLLAGCLIAAVGVKRLLQRRRRRPGETIAMPAEPARLEQVLEASSEPGSVDLLDRALRTLAHHAGPQTTTLPSVRGARVTSRTVELLVDTDTVSIEPLAPFTATADGRWTLDEGHTLLTADQAREAPAPYPGLVTLGAEPDGSHLLLNLTSARVLLLDGDDDAVRDTARAIALEAATSTWSDHAEILTIGLGTELPALLPQGRMRVVPHLRAAQSELGELLLEHHQGGYDGEEAPAPLPWLLICSAEATVEGARQLADALAASRDLPVALVLPAKGVRAAFPDAVCLTAGADTPQRLDLLDSDLVVQSLTEEDYKAFLDVLQTAEEPAHSAEGAWQLVSPAALDTPTEPNRPSPEPHFAGLAAVPETSPFTALTASTTSTSTSPASVPDFTSIAPHKSREADDSGGNAWDVVEPAGAAAEPATPAGEPTEPVDLHAPEIQVLGPVTVTGIQASGHGFKLALLAALLRFKDGCSIDTAREAMDPRSPWSKQTLQVRISELRNRLGADADGTLYLPKNRAGTYRLSPKVRCDWDRFQQLAERGLDKGSVAGITDLEAALALVRGAPFGGADLTWAAARIQEMLVRITDVAHTLATWHRSAPRPDLDAARRAIRIGLDVDDSAELLYQDWMLIEDQAANRAGVRTAYETLRDINRRLNVGMEPETERIYDTIMSRSA